MLETALDEAGIVVRFWPWRSLHPTPNAGCAVVVQVFAENFLAPAIAPFIQKAAPSTRARKEPVLRSGIFESVLDGHRICSRAMAAACLSSLKPISHQKSLAISDVFCLVIKLAGKGTSPAMLFRFRHDLILRLRLHSPYLTPGMPARNGRTRS